ncbi:MAG: tetratricopeptide repeat protein [Sphingomonadales bacterium]
MKRHQIIVILAIASVLSITHTASANRTYFGEGLGKACFDAVELGSSARKDLDLCSQALTSGTLTGKNVPATYVNRGIIFMRMERYKDAIADYEQALDIDPALAEAKINMGAALIGLRRYASAIAYLEEGLTETPISPHVAYYNLGIAHELIGDFQSARAHYSSALEIAPEWTPALRKLESLSPADAVTTQDSVQGQS